IDLQGNITFVNPAAATMLGWENPELAKDALNGQPFHDVVHHAKSGDAQCSGDDCPVIAPIAMLLQAQTAYDAKDEVFYRKDGTSFPVECVSTSLKQNGRIIGAVV